MKSGAIAIPKEAFTNPDESNFPKTRTEDGEDLRSSLEMRDAAKDLNGFTVHRGQGAREHLVSEETFHINEDGQIVNGDRRVTVATQVSEFLSIPGEFIVAETLGDDFIHDLFTEGTQTEFFPASLDLGEFADDHPDAQYWMGGFYNHEGAAENGVAHGEDVFSDEDIGEVVRNSDKNRLGLQGLSWRGVEMKVMMTESGYVEVYRPSDFGAMEFVKFLRSEILPYAQITK